MSVETPPTPVPGVRYCRVGAFWVAPGRPSLPATAREALVPTSYLPDEHTTGLVDATVLEDVVGDVAYGSISAGAVIRNKRFLGKVSVSAPGVRFVNCLFLGPSSPSGQDPLLLCTNAAVVDLVVEDSEFRPRAPGSGTNGIAGHHFTLRRVRMRGSVDCVAIIPKVGGRADVVIVGSWLSGLAFFSPDQYQGSNATHNDLIQWMGGLGLTVVGCRLEGFYDPTIGVGATSPAVIDSLGRHVSGNPYFPSLCSTSVLLCNTHVAGTPPGELVFLGNWVDGGGSALVFSSAPAMTNVGRVEGNRFGRAFRNGPDFAILANTGATQPAQTFTLTGNTRWDDGTPFNVRKKGD